VVDWLLSLVRPVVEEVPEQVFGTRTVAMLHPALVETERMESWLSPSKKALTEGVVSEELNII
jgi:hypothetical protein